MKQILLFMTVFLFGLNVFSQSEIADLYLGDIIDVDNISIEFVELISDSRCPQNVSCIRAGEAEVLVAVYENGQFSYEKKLTFFASGVVKEDHMQLFTSNNLFVRGLTLSPYPNGLSKIPEDRYSLSIGIN